MSRIATVSVAAIISALALSGAATAKAPARKDAPKPAEEIAKTDLSSATYTSARAEETGSLAQSSLLRGATVEQMQYRDKIGD